MKPTLSDCIQILERLTTSVRLNELEQFAVLEVLQVAAWWHEDKLGKVSRAALRRRSRRFSTRRFDRMFKDRP